jgi:hypothetical protein
MLHHSILVLIGVALVVAISPEATKRMRVIDHDESLAVSVLVQRAEETHKVFEGQSVGRVLASYFLTCLPPSSITSLISLVLCSCI